jgi:hypothetical protein
MSSPNWKLVSAKTGEEIHVGDTVFTSDGERVTLIGLQPPHRPGTTGKVYVEDSNRRSNVWYVGVVGCRFERARPPVIVDGQFVIED